MYIHCHYCCAMPLTMRSFLLLFYQKFLIVERNQGHIKCLVTVNVLHSLWWHGMSISFKLLVLVYKSLHGLAPPYLSDDCQLVTDVGHQHLRSSDVYTCVVPWTQSQIADRSFSVAGPRLWNNLPIEIRRRGTTFKHYRRLLKAFLFVEASAHSYF